MCGLGFSNVDLDTVINTMHNIQGRILLVSSSWWNRQLIVLSHYMFIYLHKNLWNKGSFKSVEAQVGSFNKVFMTVSMWKWRSPSVCCSVLWGDVSAQVPRNCVPYTVTAHNTQSVLCLFSLKQFVEDRVNWTLPYVRTYAVNWIVNYILLSLFRNILS